VRAGIHEGPTGYQAFLINNQDGVDTTPSIGTDIQFSGGQDGVFELGRIGGVWHYGWQNLTNPALSGSFQSIALPALDSQSNLYVGIFNNDARNTTPQTATLDYFKVLTGSEVPEHASLAANVQPQFVTVSLRSVANHRFDWIPINETGIKTLDGVPFDLLSASGKNVWYSAVGTTLGKHSTQTLEIPVNIHGSIRAYSLINTSWVIPGSSTVSMSFVCSEGTQHKVTLKSGENIRDFNKDGYVSTVNEKLTQNVMPDWKQGHIDRQQIELPKEFASRTLTRVVLTDTGVTGKDIDENHYNVRVHAQRSFILGLTIETTADNAKQLPSFDEVTQNLLDETISKLKGPQAKRVAELKQKYKHDSGVSASQRRELDDEMQREILKVMVLSDAKPSDVNQGESDLLKAIDDALAKAPTDTASAIAKSQAKKEILAAIDQNNVWDEATKTRQYEIVNAAPKEKRIRLVRIYIKYEPKFTAQVQREWELAEQYKRELLEIVAPDRR
jgi:hypothetical protein